MPTASARHRRDAPAGNGPAAVDVVAAECSSRREYRASTVGRRAFRARQRHDRRRELTRRLVPGVVAATVLLGAGELLTAHSSVDTADAGTSRVHASPVDAAVSSLGGRPTGTVSRAAVRPVLTTTNSAGVHSQVSSAEVAGALRSTMVATGDLEDSVETEVAADEARRAAFSAPVRGARVTSGYGQRWGRMHHGMDFGADVGHPLYAVAEATVTTASYNSGLGHHVRITLSDGTEVSYGHLSTVLVENGDEVEPGTLIGRVGSSGSSTGAHLHLEVRDPDGERVDPHPWLVERDLL